MKDFKSLFNTNVVVICGALFMSMQAQAQTEILSTPLLRTHMQLDIQERLYSKRPKSDTTQGECFFVEDKSVGFVQKCKIVKTKEAVYENTKLHTTTRIINIDRLQEPKGSDKPRYAMNALDAEVYQIKNNRSETTNEGDKTEKEDSDGPVWSCIKSIVMDVCYKD